MSDLLDDGGAITTTIDFAPTVRESKRTNPDGLELGVCRVCGQEAAGPSGTYCAEHKTRQAKGSESPVGTGAVSVSRPARSGRGAPTGEEWSSKVFDKAVILVTALFAGSMVRRYGLNDPNDAIADSLTMEAEEARRVARPLGRYIAGTNFSRKQGRKVLENSDLLDAGFALYDYFDRVNKTLRQYTANATLASVTPIRTPEGGDDGQTEQAATDSGFSGDFPDLSGQHYVP